MFICALKIMELSEKQQLLWEENTPRFEFTLPINSFPVHEYIEALDRDCTKIVSVHDLTSGKSQNLVNAIDLAKTSRQSVGILHSADVDYQTREDTLYVFHDNLAQALLTEFRTRSSTAPTYRQTHAHLEFRDSYWLSDKLICVTLNQLRYVGNSPIDLIVEVKRRV
jgi:hypothetical protein